MPAAGNWATGLGALQDAIGFYMRLREQKYDRDRLTASDARADRQLRFNEEEALRDNQRADEESLRQRIQFQATNYGGQPISQPDAQVWRQMGYGSALEDEQTLPASQKGGMPILQDAPGAPTGMASPMKTIAQYSPQTPTGRTMIRQPESERMRISYYNALARSQEGDRNRASRDGIAARQAAVRAKQIEAMLAATDQRVGAQIYGINVHDATARMRLAEQMAWRETLGQNMSQDNQFLGGPLGMILRGMPPGSGFNVPQTPPLYYSPPAFGAGPGAGGVAGSSDWEIIP